MNNTMKRHKKNTYPTFLIGLSCLLILTFILGMLHNLPLGDASTGVKNAKLSKMNPPKKIAFSEDNLWGRIASGVGNIGVKLGSSAIEMREKGITYAFYKYITAESGKNKRDPVLNAILPVIQTYCQNHLSACKEIGNWTNIIDTAKKEADSIEKKLKPPYFSQKPVCQSNMKNITTLTKNPITIIILTRKCYGTLSSTPSGTKMNMSSDSSEKNNQDVPHGGSGDALSTEQRKCLNERMRIAEALKDAAAEKERQEAQQQARDKNRRDFWDAEFKKFQQNREKELQDRIKCLKKAIQQAEETLNQTPKDKQALQQKRSAENEIRFLEDVIKQLLNITKEWERIKMQSGENLTKNIDRIKDLYRRNGTKVYNWNPNEPMNNIVPATPRKK